MRNMLLFIGLFLKIFSSFSISFEDLIYLMLLKLFSFYFIFQSLNDSRIFYLYFQLFKYNSNQAELQFMGLSKPNQTELQKTNQQVQKIKKLKELSKAIKTIQADLPVEKQIIKNAIKVITQQIKELQKQPFQNQNEDLRKLNQLRSKGEKLLERVDYCFDSFTNQFVKQILEGQDLSNLYRKRTEILKKFQKTQTIKKSNSNQLLTKQQKIKRLKKISWLIQQKIDYQEQYMLTPFNFQKTLQRMKDDFTRKVNFFIVVAWIIDFILAYGDYNDPANEELNCLNEQLLQTGFNFRGWLKVNGWVTLFSMLIIFLQNTFYGKLWNDSSKVDCCQNIIVFIGIIFLVVKIILIILGIALFLQLDFKTCDDNVINYCSLEFLAFFTFFLFIFLNCLFQWILNCTRQKINEQFYYENDQINSNQQLLFVSSQHLQEPNSGILHFRPQLNEQTENFSDKSLYLHVDLEDLSDISSKIILWVMIGWIYDLVLFFKDSSNCLTDDLLGDIFNFKTWLFIDATISLSMIGLIVVLLSLFIISRSDITLWRRQRTQVFKIELKWFYENRVRSVLFLFVFVGKFVWIIVGVFILCIRVNVYRCNQNVSGFLIVYYTEIIYVIVELINKLIKGYRAKNKLKNEQIFLQQNTQQPRGQINRLNQMQNIQMV